MTTRERISQYLKYKGISDYRFEKDISVSKGYWSKCANPTAEILDKICGVYTDISAEWLLRGIEPMIKVDSPSAGVINSGTNTGIINTGNMENVNNNSEPSKEQLVSKMEELQRMFDKVMCK